MIRLLIFICNGRFFMFVYTVVVIDVPHSNFFTGTASMLFCRIVKRYEPSDLPIHIFQHIFIRLSMIVDRLLLVGGRQRRIWMFLKSDFCLFLSMVAITGRLLSL